MRHFLDLLKALGPVGVFLLSIVESAGIPNPGGTDFLLLFLAAAKPADAMLCAALAIAGSLIGSVIFYELTRKGGERFLVRYASSVRGKRFQGWFQRYGMIAVFIPALLPIPILPFKVFAACAGATGVSRKRFFLILSAARIPRYLALAFLGAQLGENAGEWLRSHVWPLLALATLLAVVLSLVVRRANRETLQ